MRATKGGFLYARESVRKCKLSFEEDNILFFRFTAITTVVILGTGTAMRTADAFLTILF